MAWSVPVLAADSSLIQLKIIRQVELKKGPSQDSDSVGIVPVNTLAQDRKAKVGNYRRIGVELQNGDMVEGWVPADSLKTQKRSTASDENSGDPSTETPANNDKDSTQPPPPKNGKVIVPADEAMVIQRSPTFFYGVQGGVNLGIIQASTNQAFYYGYGFVGGGYIGIFLDKDVPIRFELNVTQANATANISTGTANLGFNYMEFGLVPAYRFSNFEIFGGITYSLGIGIGYVPPSISLPDGATDMSSIGGELGVGYRMALNTDFFLAIRGRFLMNFLRTPFAVQSAGLLLALEFQG